MARNPTERFSDRVDDYVRSRPSYPPRLIETLARRTGLGPASVVADIGAGTGVLTALLLPLAGRVLAVEPNAAMRTAAEARHGDQPGFASVAATAEATTLPANSVDLITVAQAFHWFDPIATRREFARILKPGGWVALIWNERELAHPPFMAGYEDLLRRRALDYDQHTHGRIDEEIIARFFAPAGYKRIDEPSQQVLDLAGLESRALSSSYVPRKGQPGHEAFMAELRDLFARHAVDGRVDFPYLTKLYLGRLS